jgi:hypothetical protein
MVARFSVSSQGSQGKEFAMRIYYRGPDAIVTSELFVRRGSPAGRFAIRDLRGVCIAPGEPEGVRLSAIVIPAAATALGAAAVVSVAGGVAVAVGILLAATGTGAACAVFQQHRVRRFELRGVYRDQEITLYASTDARVFNQVARALRRAMENARPPTWDGEEAA